MSFVKTQNFAEKKAFFELFEKKSNFAYNFFCSFMKTIFYFFYIFS